MNVLSRISNFAGKTFIIWILLFGVISFIFPGGFHWISPYVSILLGIIMFGMGINLSFSDFREVAKHPVRVLLGVLAHFIIMPGLAFILAKVFHLPTQLAIGVILVGSCPSGSASNVMTFLAKGNTALAVAIASVSTLLASIVTPVIIYLLASEWLQVSIQSMALSVVEIVLVPVLLGLFVQFFFKKAIQPAKQAMPLVSVIAIVAILSTVVAGSRNMIVESGLLVFVVVVLHNLLGYTLGFFTAKLFKFDYASQKAITFEVGMQNSGLGAALATAYFSPAAAVPSALFSFWHNVSGPLLATYWAAKMEKIEKSSIDATTLANVEIK